MDTPLLPRVCRPRTGPRRVQPRVFVIPHTFFPSRTRRVLLLYAYCQLQCLEHSTATFIASDDPALHPAANSRNSVICTAATSWTAEELGVDSWQGAGAVFILKAPSSTPGLEKTQHPVLWIPWTAGGGKVTIHFRLVQRLRMNGAIPPPYLFQGFINNIKHFPTKKEVSTMMNSQQCDIRSVGVP
jgi:hypothetical protein